MVKNILLTIVRHAGVMINHAVLVVTNIQYSIKERQAKLLRNTKPRLDGFGFMCVFTVLAMTSIFTMGDNKTFIDSIKSSLSWETLWLMIIVMFIAIGLPSLVKDIRYIHFRRKNKLVK